MNTLRKSLCVAVSGLVVGLFAAEAIAQQVPPAAPAAKAAAPAKAAKAPAKAKSTTASACKGLEQKACGAKSDCSWIAATKRKDGKDVKAYCRTKPKQSADKSKTKVKTVAKSTPAAAPPAKQ